MIKKVLNKKRKHKKAALIFLFFSAAAIFMTVLVGMVLVPEYRAAEEMEIVEIDLRRIPDGTYYGTAETIMAAADVAVTVEEKRITKIELIRHVHSNGAMAEAVLDQIIEKQTLSVDAVSGATISSLVLLKAVEEALIYKHLQYYKEKEE